MFVGSEIAAELIRCAGWVSSRSHPTLKKTLDKGRTEGGTALCSVARAVTPSRAKDKGACSDLQRLGSVAPSLPVSHLSGIARVSPRFVA